MRKILFRAKSKDAPKEWVYGVPLVNQHGTGAFLLVWDQEKQEPTYTPVDMTTLGQFTGCYDKHNNPIYEGDIVVGSGNLPLEVKYENLTWVLVSKMGNINLSEVVNQVMVVIGNIYDGV